MMDYHSSQAQPGKDERIKDILNSLSDAEKSCVSEEVLMEIVEKQVSEAPEFSMTGYAVFGKSQAVENTRIALSDASDIR